ncbi:hypothetical protein J7E99_11810 [Streptomyces sp. ISL-44]|uniref:hypothetical protein n=1 Tax=Streptomyces sp. ISL-44 TaxID=2819184 RepID=UPI001BE79C38|nr:hypothetical protein [Streptomyces sp. ISL-44]MBT2541376.1 hypothetical protein [Streptomyces sp. ISL-44]
MQTVKLAEVANVADSKGAFLFGGKTAGRKNPKKELVTVRAEFLPRGIVKLFNAETGAEVLHSRSGVFVFAGPVTAVPATAAEKPKAPRKKVAKAPQGAPKRRNIRLEGGYSLTEWGGTFSVFLKGQQIGLEHSEADAVAKVESHRASRSHLIPGKAPKNWIELAQSGNTEAARRYWSRRVAEYEG